MKFLLSIMVLLYAVDDYPILAPLPIATKEFYAEALLRKSGDNNNS